MKQFYPPLSYALVSAPLSPFVVAIVVLHQMVIANDSMMVSVPRPVSISDRLLQVDYPEVVHFLHDM